MGFRHSVNSLQPCAGVDAIEGNSTLKFNTFAMCNCFSLHSSLVFSCTFGSKLTHKTLLIPPNLALASYTIHYAKPKTNLPKSTTSHGSQFFDEKDDDRGVGFLEFNDNNGGEAKDVLMRNGLELDKGIVRKGKQMMKRSNLIAKQVISIHSALSLGFVSQLWVDIHSWIVFLVEVRPNLLSAEVERFLLEDVKQVGDVVLVEDESVMENVFKLVGLQTLVGYSVVTPHQRNIGKVRGYTFNINSGAVETLELDCLGISVIPSSLVSTYCLLVEDVADVFSDTIVVQEAAASRLQRLTKGLWDAQKMAYSADKMEDYSDNRNPRSKPDYGRSRKKSSGKKLRKKMKEVTDDWELPMDFF